MWAYYRFALSLRDVEDLLAARGIIVSYETIRDWLAPFGTQFAASIRRERARPADKWHLDEVVIPVKGVENWLWRAVDANGDVLDILVQSRRNKGRRKTRSCQALNIASTKVSTIGQKRHIAIQDDAKG